jgi:hypothetical protein
MKKISLLICILSSLTDNQVVPNKSCPRAREMKAQTLLPMNTSTISSSRMRVAILISACFVMLAVMKKGHAATLSRAGEIVVTSVTTNAGGLGSAFLAGDVFSYTLSYEDSVLDMDSDPDYGEFASAITGLTLAPLTSRPNIWQPSGNWLTGTVYTEKTGTYNWSFDVAPDLGFGPTVNGFAASLFYMGFGGLAANGDAGGGQTLGQVTGAILNGVSPMNTNAVELSFTQGMNSELVTFSLTNFHAPEPGRTLLMGVGLVTVLFRRRRK